MDFLSIGALILRSLGVIANNPALGGGSSLRLSEFSELLGLFGQLFERGDEALDELQAFADIVESMAKEGRAPTREEWAILRGRSDEAHETIQEAAARARAEQEAEDQLVSDIKALETLISTLEETPEEERTDEQNQALAQANDDLDDLVEEEEE